MRKSKIFLTQAIGRGLFSCHENDTENLLQSGNFFAFPQGINEVCLILVC